MGKIQDRINKNQREDTLRKQHQDILMGRRNAWVPPVEVKIPEPKLRKGHYLGLCNRSACLAPGANWYNRGSYAFYCRSCALMLNRENARWVSKTWAAMNRCAA